MTFFYKPWFWKTKKNKFNRPCRDTTPINILNILYIFCTCTRYSYIDARSNTTTVIRNSILYICTNDIFFKQHSPNQSAREKLARLSRGFIHALGIPMRARGHGLHGRRKLVDPIGPPAKKLQQIWEGFSRASRGCNLRPIYATIAREWENSSIPQRLDEARASQIWVQHTPNPYTSVHNAASTDEAQTFWGRL